MTDQEYANGRGVGEPVKATGTIRFSDPSPPMISEVSAPWLPWPKIATCYPMPSRWVRFWHWVLLGLTWRRYEK